MPAEKMRSLNRLFYFFIYVIGKLFEYAETFLCIKIHGKIDQVVFPVKAQYLRNAAVANVLCTRSGRIIRPCQRAGQPQVGIFEKSNCIVGCAQVINGKPYFAADLIDRSLVKLRGGFRETRI